MSDTKQRPLVDQRVYDFADELLRADNSLKNFPPATQADITWDFAARLQQAFEEFFAERGLQ
jgi:hypothetical protein